MGKQQFFCKKIHVRPVRSDDTETMYFCLKKTTNTGFKSYSISGSLPIKNQTVGLTKPTNSRLCALEISKLQKYLTYSIVKELNLTDL